MARHEVTSFVIPACPASVPLSRIPLTSEISRFWIPPAGGIPRAEQEAELRPLARKRGDLPNIARKIE